MNNKLPTKNSTLGTDLQEIYQASVDGRGDLLIVSQDFAQAVHMTSDRTFELETDITKPNTIDDITSKIAWNVISKNGRVVESAYLFENGFEGMAQQ